MAGFYDLSVLLDQAIKAFSNREFLTATEIFGKICIHYPENWSARYFHAMALSAIGDFSDAREQLIHITKNSEELVWHQVARSGLCLVNTKEQNLRQSLAGLMT